MRLINWIGDGRMIPYYGLAIRGCEKNLPDDMAASFVSQGIAEYVSPNKKALTKSGNK